MAWKDTTKLQGKQTAHRLVRELEASGVYNKKKKQGKSMIEVHIHSI